MRTIFAFVTGALLAASPAFAADDAGFYAGAGIGDSSLKLDHSDAIRFDGSSTSFKVFGGYQFFKFLGAELEYIDGGTADDTWHGQSEGYAVTVKNEVGISGFNASVLGILPIGDKFSLFAKLGWFFWDADLKERITYPDFGKSTAYKDSESDNDFSWGIGAGFDFTDNLGVRLEYQGFEIQDVDTAEMFSGSVLWKF